MSSDSRERFIKYKKVKEYSKEKNRVIAQRADAIMRIANPFEQLKKSPQLPLKGRYTKKVLLDTKKYLYNNIRHLAKQRRAEQKMIPL
ncbi:hypothetical protein HW132_13090 [Brasilonema sp. CT11]|nr:hypothetical protein [Brasilonema sp. CT11]